jgi:hypothetical protein
LGVDLLPGLEIDLITNREYQNIYRELPRRSDDDLTYQSLFAVALGTFTLFLPL